MNFDSYPGMVNTNGYTAKQAFKSVGKGWRHLVKVALKYKPYDVRIVQVKEKFATLHIYFEPYDPAYNVVTNTLQSISGFICEWCGNVGSIDKRYLYVLTLCPSCKKLRTQKKEEMYKDSAVVV